MYSQSFSPRNLYFCSTQSERRNSGLSKEDFVQEIESCIGDSIDKGIYEFKIKNLQGLFLNDKKDPTEHICQDLVLRKLYYNIKRIYSIEQANRNQIVKQMISLLKEDAFKWVIRLDIQHFYESIDRDRLIERFQDDGRLNYQSISLLKEIFETLRTEIGLPRGLSISSVMSELYMKYFDLEIRRTEGVFYYARFVDDIIIFCSTQNAQEKIWNSIPCMLSKLGLKLNMSKSYKWFSGNTNVQLTYLGYTFFPKGKKNITITIADKKINALKTRITKSFVRFAKDGNFDLLKKRIKFLTGNFTLYNKTTLLPIKVGIYFNYQMINDKSALRDMDTYYQKLLHCRTGRLGDLLRIRMTKEQTTELEKYSFVFGFDKHVNHYFPSATLAEITNCWK